MSDDARRDAPPGGRAVTVVGIGADGWAGLTGAARAAVCTAEVVLGGARHLDYLPDEVTAVRVPWPSPLRPALPGLLAEHAGREVCVLASGDPMLFGIGTTLVGLLGPDRIRVLPHPSSVSLACARLGWAAEDVEVVSTVGRPLERLRALLCPGARLLVLSAGRRSPGRIARLLTDDGWGGSAMTVLENLGGPGERVRPGTAAGWAAQTVEPDPLNVVALDCVADAGARAYGRAPGLPDDAYDHDGQLTKRDVRAVTLARLAPTARQVLWDVGAGAGSIGIEWMRAAPGARAIAVEYRPERAARVAGNAAALGVPDLEIVLGRAPEALVDLPDPDAVFVGGGAHDPKVLDVCWSALRPGGRLVVNAVTLQTEATLVARHAELGGDLVRLAVSHAGPVGGFTGWTPHRPVTQWTVTRCG